MHLFYILHPIEFDSSSNWSETSNLKKLEALSIIVAAANVLTVQFRRISNLCFSPERALMWHHIICYIVWWQCYYKSNNYLLSSWLCHCHEDPHKVRNFIIVISIKTIRKDISFYLEAHKNWRWSSSQWVYSASRLQGRVITCLDWGFVHSNTFSRTGNICKRVGRRELETVAVFFFCSCTS